MRKNERGVTLIALVVTIIVLLILAGVSIAMLTGDNGILTNAKKAQLSNTEAEAIEKMNVAYNTVQTEVMVKTSTSTTYVPNAASNAEAIANLAVKELGAATLEKVTAEPALADVTVNGYHVYLVTTTGENPTTKIVMLYKDSTFGAAAVTTTPTTGYPDANKQYPCIRGEITLTSSGVTYTAKPVRSVN